MSTATYAGGTISSSGSWATENEAQFNYNVVVQIPVPFENFEQKIAFYGNLKPPSLPIFEIPEAVSSFLTQAPALFQNIINDAKTMIEAVPEATLTIAVKMGSITLYSVKLVAQHKPVDIDVPIFSLAAPSFATSLESLLGSLTPFAPTIPLSIPPPTTIPVPVPVPNIKFTPIFGDKISAASAALGSQVSAASTSVSSVKSSVSIPAV